MKYKTFNKLVLFSILLPFVSIILLNFIIDPYYVFDSFQLKGVNVVKNNSISQEMTKFHTAKRANPTVLLIGTSRTEYINPIYLHKYFPNEKIYNLSIPASGVLSQKNNIKYFIENKQIKAIVYGLDFFAFSPINNNFETKDKRYMNDFTKDYMDSLLSLRTLRKSFLTLKDNIKSVHTERDYSNGWINNRNKYLEISKKGDKYITKNIEKTLDKYSSTKMFYDYEPFLKSNSINASLAELKNIIELCHKNNIKLYMFISPINTKLTDLIYKIGLKETYHYWKKELSQYENIYDFSGYNSITSNVSNYFDASHYQTEIAPLMFAQIFKDSSVVIPNDFGILLTPKTIDNILQKEHSIMATNL